MWRRPPTRRHWLAPPKTPLQGANTTMTITSSRLLAASVLAWVGAFACGGAGQQPSATNDSGTSDAPDPRDAPDAPDPPPPVSDLVATAGDHQVVLRWTDPSNDALAAIELSWQPGDWGAILLPPGTQSYTASQLVNDTEYTFSAVAVGPEGGRSEPVSISATPKDATGPRNVSVVWSRAGDAEIALVWSEPGDADFAGVDVSWTPDGTASQRVDAGNTSLRLGGLTNGTAYTVELVAVDAAGNAAAGVTLEHTPTASVESPDLAAEDDTGARDDDHITGLATGLTISGAGYPPGFAVQLYADESAVGAPVTVDAEGNWSQDIDLTDGTHAVVATVVDAGGEALWSSGVLEIEVIPLTPPKLLRPRNGLNTATDLTPTFQWAALEADETVDIQLDDSPEFSSPDYEWTELTGTTFEPSTDLDASTDVPVGTRYYVRIRRRDADGVPGPWSPTAASQVRRYVNVGRFDGDFNGDGFADVLAGAWRSADNRGRAYLLYGFDDDAAVTDADLAAASPITFVGDSDATSKLGYSVTFAGDVNADGFADVLVGAPEHTDGARAYIFHGRADLAPGTTVEAAQAEQIISAPEPDVSFGFEVAGAGDVDANGQADVLIGAFANDASAPRALAHLYLAGAAASPATTIEMPAAAQSSVTDANGAPGKFLALDGIGDINGDGFWDIVVASPTDADSTGQIAVFRGAAAMPSAPTPVLTLQGSSAGDGLGRSATFASDFDGDGFDDLLVGSEHQRVYLYTGGADMDATADFTFTGVDTPASPDGFGRTVASIGDFQGDGADDIAIGVPNSTYNSRENNGWVLIYFGGESTADTAADRGILGSRADSFFGLALGSSGDLNADGTDDITIGAPGDRRDTGTTGDGRVYLLAGRDGSIPKPNQSLAAPAGDNSREAFGSSVGAGR